MKLAVVELNFQLRQVIKSKTVQQVEGIRLHLYKHRNPAGSLRAQIRDDMTDEVLAQSEPLNISEIPGLYYHGQILFPLNIQLKKNTKYSLVLISEGYAFIESDYVGWCLDFDFKTYPKGYDDKGSNIRAPFNYEFWTRQNLI